MSDDQHNQGPHRGRSHGHGERDQQDDGEKTQLVDLDALHGGSDEPQFAPPPTMDSVPVPETDNAPPPTVDNAPPPTVDNAPPPTVDNAPPPTVDNAPSPTMGSSADSGARSDFEEKTELFEMPASPDETGGNAITSSAPDYGDGSFEQYSSSHGQPHQSSSQPPSVSSGGSGSVSSGSRQFSSVDSGDVAPGDGSSAQPPPPQSGPSAQQVYVPSDDDAGHDGATAFINVNDFAEQKAHFTPEQEQAGYDGSTQFVDVNALQSGTGDGFGGADSIDNDDDLHRGYHFQPDDVHRGDVTFIHAQNALGKDIVLKRVWEDEPHTMSAPLRERIAELHELQHPNLVAMNGMFVSDSGMWAELDAPRGQRLTRIIEENGPLDPKLVLQWAAPIADVLEEVHANQLAYANLTTDAVWIGDDGSVLVEPFDMLRLEDRGNLGAFGPPEMEAPPEQRQLSPATDVYSLAAVIGAAVNGLPFHPEQLVERDDLQLVDKLLPALSPDPSERPPTIAAFRTTLSGGFNLADLDIKIVGAGVFAVLFLGVAVLAFLAGDGDGAPPDDTPPDEQVHAQAQAVEHQQDIDPESQGDEAAPPHDDDPVATETSLDLPRAVHTDERLTIITTYEDNPPADAIQRATDHQLDQWRTEAEDLIADAEAQSSDEDKFDYYSSALEVLTRIIRKQADPDQDDIDTWQRVYDEDVIQDEIESTIESLDEAITDGRIGTANRRYHRLSQYNPFVGAEAFMNTHRRAEIVPLGSEDEDDD